VPYWRLHYHVVWATHRREPILHGEARDVVEAVIRNKLKELGCVFQGIYVMPDHVHLAVSIPPKMAVSDVVADVKAVSSYLVKKRIPEMAAAEFRWQSEYGVVSFGEKALPVVTDYIANQEQRHREGPTWSTLERDTDIKD
jgi:putative transposase